MQLNREIIDQLVPTALPPESLIRSPDLAAAVRFESPTLARSYLWTRAITRAAFESNLQIPPRFNHFSAGFVPITDEEISLLDLAISSPSAGGLSFGGYILTRSTSLERIQNLSVGDQRFPITTVSGEIELHGCPPHPVNGAAACWVKNHGGVNPWQTGILSCRHIVAGLPLGTSISLTPSSSHSSPKSATLVEIDESTIDASVLEVDQTDWPTGLSSLSVSAPGAPGQIIELDGRFTSKKSGSVLRVYHDPGYVGNLLGQRLITDCYGIPGDSGSLLLDGTTKAGMGIYMGTIPDGKGGRDGIFQDLSQVASYFGLTLYR